MKYNKDNIIYIDFTFKKNKNQSIYTNRKTSNY